MVSNKRLGARRDEFVSQSGGRPLLSKPNSPGSSRESKRRLPGCLIRTFRYLTIICTHWHGGYYYLGREAASQEMVSFPRTDGRGKGCGSSVHDQQASGAVGSRQQRLGRRVESH